MFRDCNILNIFQANFSMYVRTTFLRKKNLLFTNFVRTNLSRKNFRLEDWRRKCRITSISLRLIRTKNWEESLWFPIFYDRMSMSRNSRTWIPLCSFSLRTLESKQIIVTGRAGWVLVVAKSYLTLCLVTNVRTRETLFTIKK